MNRAMLLRTGFSMPQLARIALTLLVLLSFSAALVSCGRQPTDAPDSALVKLRDDLRRFATGNLDVVEGHTLPEHSYVLLYGYQGDIESLPVSEKLQKELQAMTPQDYEKHVLVHIVGDEVNEYTEWAPRHDPSFWPVPLMIKGSPFRITATERSQNIVTIEVR